MKLSYGILVFLLIAHAGIAQRKPTESGTQILVATPPETYAAVQGGLASSSVHVYLAFPLRTDGGGVGGGEVAPPSNQRFNLLYFPADKHCSFGQNGKDIFTASGISLDECLYLVKRRLPG
jgi:hypothetical protein